MPRHLKPLATPRELDPDEPLTVTLTVAEVDSLLGMAVVQRSSLTIFEPDPAAAAAAEEQWNAAIFAREAARTLAAALEAARSRPAAAE